jgi:excisionase family DNA binding protein
LSTANTTYIAAKDAARTLGLSMDYVYRLLMAGKLSGRKVDRNWEVDSESVERYRRYQQAREGVRGGGTE